MKSIITFSLTTMLFIVLLTGYEFKVWPLSFKLKSPYEALGWLMVFVGIVMIAYHTGKSRYKEGYNNAIKDVLSIQQNNKSEK